MHHLITRLTAVFIAGTLLTACAPDTGTVSDAPDPEGSPSAGVVFADGAASGAINEIHPPYGNLDTVFTEADLNRIGLAQGDRFQVEANGNTLEVTWATTYEDVPEGSGVAFLNWEDKLRIARNHASAAETLGVTEEDIITIRPLAGSVD